MTGVPDGGANKKLEPIQATQATPGDRRGTTTGKKSTSEDFKTETEEESEERFGAGTLDQNMTLMRRKTIAVKSDNVSGVLMSNIGSISESVANF